MPKVPIQSWKGVTNFCFEATLLSAGDAGVGSKLGFFDSVGELTTELLSPGLELVRARFKGGPRLGAIEGSVAVEGETGLIVSSRVPKGSMVG